ncbi:MAG: DUF4112 domain-containing protein [Novosphingobium sp.]
MTQMGTARYMASEFPLGTDPRSVRRRIEAMEKLLENTFRIPVINQRVGLDAIAGLVPVGGDIVTGLLGLYIVWEARNLGMSKWQLARMTANVGIDSLLGMIPFVGDLFDFVFRSNTMNLKIVHRHLDRHHPATRTIDG